MMTNNLKLWFARHGVRILYRIKATAPISKAINQHKDFVPIQMCVVHLFRVCEFF